MPHGDADTESSADAVVSRIPDADERADDETERETEDDADIDGDGVDVSVDEADRLEEGDVRADLVADTLCVPTGEALRDAKDAVAQSLAAADVERVGKDEVAGVFVVLSQIENDGDEDAETSGVGETVSTRVPVSSADAEADFVGSGALCVAEREANAFVTEAVAEATALANALPVILDVGNVVVVAHGLLLSETVPVSAVLGVGDTDGRADEDSLAPCDGSDVCETDGEERGDLDGDRVPAGDCEIEGETDDDRLTNDDSDTTEEADGDGVMVRVAEVRTDTEGDRDATTVRETREEAVCEKVPWTVTDGDALGEGHAETDGDVLGRCVVDVLCESEGDPVVDIV